MGLLRRVFGPSQDEVWKELSDRIGARFVKGGFFGTSKVEADVDDWTITLDTYAVSTGKTTVVYTRMRAPFIGRDGFRFTIYRKNLFSSLGKLLGMQDVEVGGPRFERLEPLFGLRGYLDPQIIESGDQQFDSEFVIKSNDESKVKLLFKRLKTRDLMQSQPDILLQIKQSKAGAAELYFQATGVIKDPDRLELLFELFAEVLRALRAMGSASGKPEPG